MASSDLFSLLIERLCTRSIASLGLGLATNSFFLYANLGAGMFGIMPSLHNVDSYTALRLNKWMYEHAKGPFLACALVSTVSYVVAALDRPETRGPLLVAALTIFSVVPYTLFVVMPVNRAVRAKVLEKRNAQDEKENRRLLESWNNRHAPRMVLSAISLAIASAVLLVS